MKYQKCYPLIFYGILVLLSVISCDTIDFDWNKYQDQNSEVWGKRRDEFTVVSHGWKIIDGTLDKSGNYEWGWEVTLGLKKVKKDKPHLSELLVIEEIEYILFDEDKFRIISNKMNLDDSGRIVWDDGEKGPLVIEVGQTETFRQTSSISKQNALRVKYGVCRIKLEN